MSFGDKEYQHRFYKQPRPRTYLPPVTPLPPVVYPYGQYGEYLYNSMLLESFKRNADYHRDRKRFQSLAHHYPHAYYDSIRRLSTETPLIEPAPLVYVNREPLPDLLSINYSHLASRVREAEQKAEIAQFQAAKQREQLRQYRHKYERLKSRLRQQVGGRKAREAESRQRREIELQQEREKIDRIGQTLMQMSQQVTNNSRIMEENLRLKEEMELEKSKIVIFPTVPTVLSSSTLVDRPTLDSQYRQMRRLKKQIGELDKRLGYTPTPS